MPYGIAAGTLITALIFWLQGPFAADYLLYALWLIFVPVIIAGTHQTVEKQISKHKQLLNDFPDVYEEAFLEKRAKASLPLMFLLGWFDQQDRMLRKHRN